MSATLIAVLTGCSAPPDAQSIAVDNLPVVSFVEPDLVIGRDPGPGDDFIMPVVVGRVATGSVYVFDIRLGELRRFDRNGVYQGLIARRGQGPGDLRTPSMITVDPGAIRVWDGRDGRLTLFSLDGKVLSDVDTGLRAGPRNSTTLIHVTADGQYIIRAMSEPGGAPTEGRGVVEFKFLLLAENGTVLDTLYRYQAPGQALRIYGGRASIMDPVPAAGPIVRYDSIARQFIRIERPIPASASSAVFTIQRITNKGRLIEQRQFSVEPTRFNPALRESIRQQMLRAASLGGSRKLGRDDITAIDEIVEWPDYLPPVEQAVLDPDGWLWIKRPSKDGGATPGEWIVFDSLLNPLVRAVFAEDAKDLSILIDQAWTAAAEQDDAPVLRAFNLHRIKSFALRP